jgi:transcriptional regulator with XRE-family HTH domain
VDGLGAWLKKEARLRGYSLREVSRRAGVSQTTVARIARGDMWNLTPETIIALAQVFDAPLADVYRLAGLLPDEAPAGLPEQLETYLKRLSPEDQERILDLARRLAESRTEM